MNTANGRLYGVAFVLAWTVLAGACSSDSPTGSDDVNPALLEGAEGIGLATAGQQLPQGSATFTGPDGLQMDATAEEFVQQLTLEDGTVLRTSGVAVRAVPDETIVAPRIRRLHFVSAATGSLESVSSGTYPLTGIVDIDFINVIKVAVASVQFEAHGPASYAQGGTYTITSLNYFDDVYPCQLNLSPSSRIAVDDCHYQIGLLRGVIEFEVPAGEGRAAVVQPRTEFSVPIQRRTIIAHLE